MDSRKLESGSGTTGAGVPSFLGFGVGGQSSSNFLASTVGSLTRNRQIGLGPFWKEFFLGSKVFLICLFLSDKKKLARSCCGCFRGSRVKKGHCNRDAVKPRGTFGGVGDLISSCKQGSK